MIEGTRQYKGGDKNSDTQPTSSAETAKAPQPELPSSSDAMNLERREWFSSLIPAFGEGLVKILRVSNNLQQELHSAIKAKTESFTDPEEEKKPD